MAKIIGADYDQSGMFAVYVESVEGRQKFIKERHGRWDEIPNKYISVSGKNGSYSGHATSCSVCHEVNTNVFRTNFCPNCGARME